MSASPLPSTVQAATAALVGGVAGSLGRGLLEWAAAALSQPAWTARIAANVVGAFLIGCWFGRTPGRPGSPPGRPADVRAALREDTCVAGFLGGFTTVSGFAWDVASAWDGGAFLQAAAVLAANAVVGVASCAAGFRAVRLLRG